MAGKKKELTTAERHNAFTMLAQCVDPSIKTGLECGGLVRTANHFDVDITTMSCNWRDWIKKLSDTD